MSKYVERVIEDVKAKYANEPEFCQTVEEVLSSIGPVVDAHPEYEKVALLENGNPGESYRVPCSVGG